MKNFINETDDIEPLPDKTNDENKENILDITFMEPSTTNNNIEDITDEELSIDDPILEELPNEGNPLLTELPNEGNPLLTEVTEFTKYQNHTIKQLKDILNEMDLPTSGNKHKLIQRIVLNKNKISN